ncbi:MAG: U32 family peptidase [Evtepia sp.]|uniref:U32 family peptidase n=1 Tax=Evtepia sp. TaxID=2773933 RepID=UPI002A75C617|nr:U32 family peptidase [Evtepia sp.]MDY3014280.1 U32 family peptidase [Evtepia sp.]
MELLAPAGSPEALRAAVQAGADAVYLGFGPLNARRNAKNFSREELEEGVSYCHLQGTRVYLTLNTLLTDRELPLAAETAALANEIGVDAILVQDLGVAKLVRETCPDMEVHASTQMTVHNLDGILACADLGMTRVVLSRELPRSEIEGLCRKSPVELELFVHGALCMAYSGQCFLSALLGGRSGNRGLCAQPCRLAYGWPGEKGTCHPLSLKDLSLAGELKELEEMGIACLKIEGRMKRAEYVSVVTGIYAAALREGREPRPQELAQLEAAFSRQGFTQGYYADRKGPEMFGIRKEGTRDPEDLFAQARQFYGRGEHKLSPVTLSATLRQGQPLTVTAQDDQGHTVTAQGAEPQPARTRPVTREQLEQQLRKTGGTVYQAAALDVQAEEGLSVPLSAVNGLRRQVLEGLDQARTQVPPRRQVPFQPPGKEKGSRETPAFSLSFRRFSQLSRSCLEEGPKLVYLPSQEWAGHGEELARWVEAFPEISFGVTFPRVVWDRELPRLRKELEEAKKAGATQALLGHVSQLALAREFGLVPRGDFGLGLLNSLTAQELAVLGFASATVSFEGKFGQIRDLNKPLETELLVYGHLPLMLMENCIMKNWGKGCHCESGTQILRDRKGESFPVESAWGCRNELFNGKALWLADKKADWTGLGVTYARLSFLREDAQTCAAIFRAYRKGEGEGPDQFTRGLYYRGVE